MQVANWAEFITTHPDADELSAASSLLHHIIDLEGTLDNNLERITSSPCLVIVINDIIRDIPLPIFYLTRLGLPIRGTKERLVGLSGFGDLSEPIEIESKKFCAATTEAIPTPNLEAFMSAAPQFASVRALRPTAGESHRIRHAAILPPAVSKIVTSMNPVTAEVLLWETLKVIERMRPVMVDDAEEESANAPTSNSTEGEANVSSETTNKWQYAEEFMPLLVTLWSFLGSTDATKAITPPMTSNTSDRKTLRWCQEVHEKHIGIDGCVFTHADGNGNAHQPHLGTDAVVAGFNRIFDASKTEITTSLQQLKTRRTKGD